MQIVTELLQNLHFFSCKKLHHLKSHRKFYLENLSLLNIAQNESFHRHVKETEKIYQGR